MASPAQKPPHRHRTRPGYPVWSPVSITLIGLVAVAIVGVSVFTLGRQSLLARTELTLGTFFFTD